jgi:hypothetical protein
MTRGAHFFSRYREDHRYGLGWWHVLSLAVGAGAGQCFIPAVAGPCPTQVPRGRPVTTGKGTLVGIRCHKEFLGRIDAWRAGQEGELSRPAAIHRLAELLDVGGRDIKRGFAD